MKGISNRRLCLVATVAVLAVGHAAAQQQVVPAAGQTAEQQQSDETACYSRAVEQSGYDPAQHADDKPHSELRGTTRGAVVGEVVREDALSGAALGAVMTKLHNRRKSEAAQKHLQEFDKARTDCLVERGYSLR